MKKVVNFLIPSTILAADSTVDIRSEVEGFFGYQCIGEFISKLVSLGIIIASLAVFLFLVWGGIEWITAGGDKQKIEEARKRLSNAIIGLTIVALAWAIWGIINYFFGVNLDSICSDNPFSS